MVIKCYKYEGIQAQIKHHCGCSRLAHMIKYLFILYILFSTSDMFVSTSDNEEAASISPMIPSCLSKYLKGMDACRNQ